MIGSDCYWRFFTGKTLKGKNNTFIASESKFGCALNRTVEKKTKEGEKFTFAINIVHVCHIQANLLHELDSQMTKSWEIESTRILNKEKPPYKNYPLIHDNFQMCQERLLKLHKKLKNDPEILSQYNEIFEEQKRLGIIKTVSEPGKKKEKHTI